MYGPLTRCCRRDFRRQLVHNLARGHITTVKSHLFACNQTHELLPHCINITFRSLIPRSLDELKIPNEIFNLERRFF